VWRASISFFQVACCLALQSGRTVGPHLTIFVPYVVGWEWTAHYRGNPAVPDETASPRGPNQRTGQHLRGAGQGFGRQGGIDFLGSFATFFFFSDLGCLCLLL